MQINFFVVPLFFYDYSNKTDATNVYFKSDGKNIGKLF